MQGLTTFYNNLVNVTWSKKRRQDRAQSFKYYSTIKINIDIPFAVLRCK